MAPLVRRNLAHGNIAKHDNMVVLSIDRSLFLNRNLLAGTACLQKL